ncbi:hypothetical protein Btru_052563 [Bulinus truncatus]|nr:hypothetical protein Btru_052563 [Bulinus truncatus]
MVTYNSGHGLILSASVSSSQHPIYIRATPFILKIQWIFFNISCNAALVVTTGYWAFIAFVSNAQYSTLMMGDMAYIKPLLTSEMSRLKHTANSIYVLADILIGATPIRIYHVFFTIFAGSLYVVFNALYFINNGSLILKTDDSTKGGRGYYFMNWSQPVEAICTAVLGMILCMVSQLCLHGLFHLRSWLHRKWFSSLSGPDSELQNIISRSPSYNTLKDSYGEKDSNVQDAEQAHFQYAAPSPRIGIGMDSSITPLRHGGLSLVQTTDFFYPLVDDPYMMGKITCANVLSDLYAMGVTDCDNMLMLLTCSNKMTDKERDVIIPIIMRGFKDAAEEAGTQVTGGQTVVNPWLTIGGVATAVCQSNEYIMPDNAVVGDVLVLTKPLGTQVAVNAYQWLDQPERWNRVKLVVSEDDVRKAYQRAMFSMARLNRTAARLMHKYNAHGATDVTGFGLLGHANNLAKIQKNEVGFVIHNLPVIAKMAAISKACGNLFGLLQGTSAETSGGLLVALPREQAAAFCKDIEKQEGYQSWIIGIVEKGNRTARIIDKPRVIEVPAKDREGELW